MKTKIKGYRAIKLKRLRATKNKSERIKLIDEYFGHSKIINFRYEYNWYHDHAIDYLSNNGFNVVGYAEMKKDCVIFCDNWGDDCIKLKDIK
jgi:hypothetical protein